MPKTKVVITVDVEPSIAGALTPPARQAPLIHEPVWGEVNGRSEALGFLLRTLANHRMHATFFVETVHTNYFPPAVMGTYVDKIVDAGQDVQLHLHPLWLNFRDGQHVPGDQIGDDCGLFEEDRIAAIISAGCDRIEHWTGRRPIGMRCGNFATSMSVFRAMKRAGLEIASNVCVAIYVPPEPELYLTGGIHNFAGVRELPLTCFSDVGPIGRGRPRPLQITALSFGEATACLNQLHDNGGVVAVVLTHPFEFLKRKDSRFTDLRRNEMVQKRFELLCRFLAENDDRFEVISLRDAVDRLPASAPCVPLAGTALRSVVRAAENFINDRLR